MISGRMYHHHRGENNDVDNEPDEFVGYDSGGKWESIGHMLEGGENGG